MSDEDSFGDDAEDMPSAKEVLVDDEGFAYISDTILQSMKDEVSLVASDLNKYARRIDGRKLCPFCPFRSFTQLALLRTHIHKHHVSSKRYVCSGTKQIKVILALHDYVAANQTAEAEYLRRSAELLRFTVAPPLDCRHANIDRHIRLVLRASGPEYINCEIVGQTPMLRRVRNIYYDHSFADLLLREMILNHGQAAWHCKDCISCIVLHSNNGMP